MQAKQLVEAFLKNTATQQIAAAIALPTPQALFAKGLKGSSSQLLASAIMHNEATANLNHIFVLKDAEEAAYFYNSLQNLSGALDIFYFPSSYKYPKNYRVLNSSNVMLRTEALSKLLPKENRQVHKKILVTYPEALSEKVVFQKKLSDTIINFTVAAAIQVDVVLEQLVNNGFERTDFVYEPGQFAVRGGIIDIYSFGNDKPYRIELFGNDVESIRIFDPETQLSERKLQSVSITPNVQTNFSSADKESLLTFLSENTVFWFDDWQFTKNKIEAEIEAVAFVIDKENGAANTVRQPEPDDRDDLNENTNPAVTDFVTAAEIESQLQKFTNVVIGSKYNLPFTKTTQADFSIDEQPAFNRQFNLLVNNLQGYADKNYTIYFFAEQASQMLRLESIFDDIDAKLVLNPILKPIHAGFIDHESKTVCYTDHQIFQRYHKYQLKQAYSKSRALTIKGLKELQQGDYVTHIDHGIGVYSGLQKIDVNGKQQEAVRLQYKDGDLLYVTLSSLHKITKYTGKEGAIPKMYKLGSDTWSKLKDKTKKDIKSIATDLIKLYAKRKAHQGFAFAPDTYLQTELEASFIYEDTKDQARATEDVKKDMEKPTPMDRLVCGDVGFGKTEVGIRAAFKAANDSKQVAVLVPTTILAYQHYKTFSERLKDFPVSINYLNRFKTGKEKKQILEDVKEGKLDIIIGTHALLGKDVAFKNLGLLIIDEEQKFGVTAKEKIRNYRETVDTLTLTATPIPRTLQFSLMGARDLSIINTAPPNRQPIQTEVVLFNEDAIRDAIYYEVGRGGQVFFIHNRVQSLKEMQNLLERLCPDLSIAMAHGQMNGAQLEETLFDFINKKYDVLVSTNIVESGVDIPNVNTIIINNAHQFGLSDLHQLRGRVGRSNKKAFCYLIAPPLTTLPSDSRKRLETLEQYSELGSGFQIAMRDLDIRGSGDLLGSEQSGFINDLGFETYQKILNEAIGELKRTEFKNLFKDEARKDDNYVSDCTIDTDLEILIPNEYVQNIAERLSLYTRLDNALHEKDLEHMQKELLDRFGPIPPPVHDLFQVVRSRKLGIELGFEKMVLKSNVLRAFFVSDPTSPYFQSKVFTNLLQYIQTKTNQASLKQVGKQGILVVNNVTNMNALYTFLQKLHDFTLHPA